MRVSAIKTEKIVPDSCNLRALLDSYLPVIPECSILAISSKIVSICEGRVIKIEKGIDKKEIIRREAEYYLPPEKNRYNIMLTMKRGILVPTAGIDESNSGGYYVLWPADPWRTAREVHAYLKRKFKLRKVGVIITDSRTTPLRRGVMGVALAWNGFRPLNDYRGKPDLFGRKLKVTTVNVADALAVVAVFAMGEGRERTPLAVVEDVPLVKFVARDSAATAPRALVIDPKTDLYWPLLKGARWRRGGGRRRTNS